jgi:hypothetical protein
MIPNAPRYVSPQEQAETRARLRKAMFWTLAAIPVMAVVLMYGYSDQAPEWLRRLSITIDGMLGHPGLWLIKLIAGR